MVGAPFLWAYPAFLGCLSRCRLDPQLKLWNLGVHSDVGLGLSLCAVPLLQFGFQRSEEVRSEHWSKGIAWTVIKPVNDKEGANSRHWEWEEFAPNRQEDARHNEETVGLSQYLKTEVQEGKQRVFIWKGKLWKCKGNKISGQCSGAIRVLSGANTTSEEPKIRRYERG